MAIDLNKPENASLKDYLDNRSRAPIAAPAPEPAPPKEAGLGDYLSLAGEGISLIPGELAATVAGAAQGREGAATRDSVDEAVLAHARRRRRYNQRVQDVTGGGFASEVVSSLPDIGGSLAYLPLGVAGAEAGAAAGSLAGPVGTLVGGTAGSIAASYPAIDRAKQYRTALEWVDQENQRRQADGRPSMSDPEAQAYIKQYQSNLKQTGFWEAGPEAVSALIDATLISRIPGSKNLLRAAGKAALGAALAEWPTETITQIGDTQALQGTPGEAGPARSFLSLSDIVTSARETAPGVVAVGGGIGVTGAAYGGIAKRRGVSRLAKEAGAEDVNRRDLKQRYNDLMAVKQADPEFNIAGTEALNYLRTGEFTTDTPVDAAPAAPQEGFVGPQIPPELIGPQQPQQPAAAEPLYTPPPEGQSGEQLGLLGQEFTQPTGETFQSPTPAAPAEPQQLDLPLTVDLAENLVDTPVEDLRSATKQQLAKRKVKELHAALDKVYRQLDPTGVDEANRVFPRSRADSIGLLRSSIDELQAQEAPAETAPAETAPAETAPAETAPAETAPVEFPDGTRLDTKDGRIRHVSLRKDGKVKKVLEVFSALTTEEQARGRIEGRSAKTEPVAPQAQEATDLLPEPKKPRLVKPVSSFLKGKIAKLKVDASREARTLVRDLLPERINVNNPRPALESARADLLEGYGIDGELTGDIAKEADALLGGMISDTLNEEVAAAKKRETDAAVGGYTTDASPIAELEALPEMEGTNVREAELPAELSALLGSIQKATGTKIQFFTTDKPSKVQGVMLGGTLYVNAAEMSKSHRFIVGHELWHQLEPVLKRTQKGAALVKKMNRELAARSQGTRASEKARVKRTQGGLSQADIYQELRGDAFATYFDSPQFWDEVAAAATSKRSARSVAKTAVEFFDRLLARQTEYGAYAETLRNARQEVARTLGAHLSEKEDLVDQEHQEDPGGAAPKMRLTPEDVKDLNLLRVALKVGDKVYEGTIEEVHSEVYGRNNLFGEDVTLGWVDPDGNFMTRREASAWLKDKSPETYRYLKQPKELESVDYGQAAGIPRRGYDSPNIDENGRLRFRFEEAKTIAANITDRAKQAHTTAVDLAKQAKTKDGLAKMGQAVAAKVIKALPLQNLKEVYGKRFPWLNEYEENISGMQRTKQHWLEKAQPVLSRLQGGLRDDAPRVQRTAILSTMVQMTPWKGLTEQDWARTPVGQQLTKEQKLELAETRWKQEKMDKKTGMSYREAYEAASSAYKDIKSDVAKDSYQRMVKIMRDLHIQLQQSVEEQIDEMTEGDAELRRKMRRRLLPEEGSIRGAYWPLKRFGKYGVYIRRKNSDKPTDYIFKMYTTRAQQGQALAQAKLDYSSEEYEVYPYSVMDKDRPGLSVPSDFVNTLMGTIKSEVGGSISEEKMKMLETTAAELWMNYLPERSALRSLAKRKTIAGVEEAQAFNAAAAHIMSTSSRLAQAKYGRKLDDILTRTKTRVNDLERETGEQADPLETALLQDLSNRLEATRTESTNALTRGATKMSSIWFMSSPSAYLVQMTQPLATGLPKLASDFGIQRGVSSLTGALKTIVADKDFDLEKLHHSADEETGDVKAAIEAFEKYAAASGEFDIEAMSRLRGGADLTPAGIKKMLKSLTPRQRELLAMKVAVLNGVMSATLVNESLEMAQLHQGTGIHRAAMYFMKKGEEQSRMATYLAAYRAATRDGKDFKEATDYAAETTNATMFQYEKEVKPAVLQKALPRALTQFQYFRFAMLGRTAALTMRSFGKDFTPEEKRQARAELGYIMSMSTILGGVLGGAPGGAAIALAQLLSGDDDEDRPVDVKTEVDQYLQKLPGGSMLARGVVAGLGADVSRRIGAADVYGLGDPSPSRAEGGAWLDQLMTSALGPFYSLARDMAVGFQKLGEGEVIDGLTRMTPKLVKDVLKASQLATKGARTSSGFTYLRPDEVSWSDVAMQLGGVAPLSVAEARDLQRGKGNLSARLSKQRSSLSDKLISAVEAGDNAALQDARDSIQEFNKNNPLFAITSRDLDTRMKNALKKQMGIGPLSDRKVAKEYGFE